ncbi:CASPA protein, partial [Nothoprocta pentlandii]|nr:CASPA protein [Nothoprocta pentlandii]
CFQAEFSLSNMGDDISLNFRQKLLLIDDNLGTEDVAALKFLCLDLIPFKKLESAQSALDIFQLLMAEEYLNEEDTFLLAELLYRIKCHFLLQKLNYTKERVQEYLPEKGRVSPYRQMLYELAENITSDMLKEIIFLLRDHLPKRQPIFSALKLLILLEKQGLLTESNVKMLEEICTSVSPDLLETVNSYKREKDVICKLTSSYNALWRNYKHTWEKVLLLASLIYYLFLLLVSLPRQENTLPIKESSRPGSTKVFSSPQVHWSACCLLDFFPFSFLQKLTSYKMDGPKRGFCLVINNVKFDGYLGERKGSCKDAGELKQVFTWLGLEVEIYKDQTAKEIKDLMEIWQDSEKHINRDCFICCILSHGESGAIYGKDGELISIRTIMSYFTAKQCPALAEKPKLFFIQACQGQKIQCPVYVEPDAQVPKLPSVQQKISPFESIPEEADFLLGMATIDGYASFRHVEQGTWYIQALCSKLQLLVPRGEDILSILTEVNEDVSRRADSLGKKKQMPQPAYTLRKKIIFPVPRDPPPS